MEQFLIPLLLAVLRHVSCLQWYPGSLMTSRIMLTVASNPFKLASKQANREDWKQLRLETYKYFRICNVGFTLLH